MLSLLNSQIAITDILMENQPPPTEEILEDGEIDDEEEEVVTEESEIIEEIVSESAGKVSGDGSQDSYENTKTISRIESTAIENNEDNVSTEEDKKRSHKRHQRKRKKHRDSKEKELRALEKKERRRKRKMHALEEAEGSVERGDSSSPHSRRRKKRKKHSRDRRDRDSTTPDSDDSVDQHSKAYYGAGNGYTDAAYSTEAYPSTKISGAYNVNNGSSAYYSTTADQSSYQNDVAESGSDFEAQLAEYQNYKTKGDFYSKEEMKSSKRKNFSQERDSKTRKKSGEMYAEFMEYDENPRRLCKFFAEGKCLKGNECSFSHDQNLRHHGTRMKKREMCKYYLAGHCHHGNHCTYMHGEYPCKYFHTGATCYAGDACRFSHDPATEETKDIIEHFKDVLSNVDDSWEINELKKLGIEARPKPPPGVGLLPTPDIPSFTEMQGDAPSEGVFSIPSIFDITVLPTADFQKRIEENIARRIKELDTACALLQLSSVASLSMTEESEDTAEAGLSRKPLIEYPMRMLPTKLNGKAILPTPAFPPNLTQRQDHRSSSSDGFYDNFYEGDHKVESVDYKAGQLKSDEDLMKMDDEFIRIDNSINADVQPEEALVKAPDFLPATQKALFLRIHGKRVTSDSEKDADKKNSKTKDPDSWTYSSDEDEKSGATDLGIIKMDAEVPIPSNETPQTSLASMEALLKMIAGKGGSTANLDTNLLSKVASVINMSTSSASNDIYNPASSVATYNPAQTKASPRHHNASSNHPIPQPRERRSNGSTNTSPGHSSKHHKPNHIRRRLSTQELTKEPVVIPLVAKQSGNQTMHSTHPDPRLTMSRLIGLKPSSFSANLPKFSKDLILPGSGKIIGLQVTLSSSEESASTKQDPRLGRHKDPRLQRSIDPRLKGRGLAKSTTITSAPVKPSALLSKSSVTIPSLPELDLNLAHVKQTSKEDGGATVTTCDIAAPSYSLPNLKLPRLVKAPGASPSRDSKPGASPAKDLNVTPPTIAPYDPRYMSSGPPKSTGPDLSMNTAPYDPRVLPSHSSLPAGMEIKKRTIQLPKLTPAPTYKPNESSSEVAEERPGGDQGDF